MPPVGERLRVALLDLHARSSMFIDEQPFRGLPEALEARGHQVTLRQSVRGGDERAAAAWRVELAAFVAGGGFHLVVLSRAWDEETLAALRGAMAAGARLVRLTHGAPAALDEQFDVVVARADLFDLVDGTFEARGGSEVRDGSEARGPAWRSTKAELKRGLQVLPTATAPPRRIEQGDAAGPGGAVGNTGVGARPTISGPAVGCPFLLDARTSPELSSVPMDVARVQTKGCSFCLDNVGAYAAFSEADVVGAWLAGLRAARASSSDPPNRTTPLEVLLTDERPHPYLPAFFRALLAEPALAPIELLIKTRVDWLVEFADGALSEALALAEAGGSVLHIYLIGFESFDQRHLDLYNKGVTVADNLVAIDTIRALAARFPRSLEFRRHRAHGIILFSPWTGPESLLENARVMRAVGFDEFRSQALRTRLRLYPHVPLHAKAVADGLLVDKFDGGRPDRAVEQGYDASVPWRFADARTEAIFRVANTLSEIAPTVPEPDVLELATRYVLRWPGLGAVPDLAARPLIAALHTWGTPLPELIRALGPTAASYDREVDDVAAGVKPACLKEGVPAAESDGLVRAYRAMGLAAATVSRHDVVEASGEHAPARAAGDRAIVAVARDEATLAEVLENQRAMESRHEAPAVARMGELMGFPACCIAAFTRRTDRGDNLDLERAPFREAPGEALHPLLNRLGAVSIISHHLCRPSCAPSITLAEARLARLSALDAAAAERLRGRLGQPVLFLDYARRATLHGGWQGDAFVVTEVEAVGGAFGFSVEGMVEIRVAPRGVRFRDRDGGERIAAGPYPLLAVPGAALWPPAIAAIARDPAVDAERASSFAAASSGPPRLEMPTPHASQGLPPLPSDLVVGTRAGDYRVVSLRSGEEAHEVVLGGAGPLITLLVRAYDPARGAKIRRGRWAIECEGVDALPDRARAAVGILARALPA